MLLLRDFFLLGATVLPMSTVAFSRSLDLRDGDWPPTDLRALRAAGSVASARDAILEVRISPASPNPKVSLERFARPSAYREVK